MQILTEPISDLEAAKKIQTQYGEVTLHKWLHLERARLKAIGVPCILRHSNRTHPKLKPLPEPKWFLMVPDDPLAEPNHHKHTEQPKEPTPPAKRSHHKQSTPGSPERPVAFGKGSRPFDTKQARAHNASVRRLEARGCTSGAGSGSSGVPAETSAYASKSA